MSTPVPLMTGTTLSRNPGIPAFGAIPLHMSKLMVEITNRLSHLNGSLGLGLDGHDLVPETLVN